MKKEKKIPPGKLKLEFAELTRFMAYYPDYFTPIMADRLKEVQELLLPKMKIELNPTKKI